ncbi:MAG: hypothetical protein ABJG88_03505 [Litorimonas sp.]
MGSFGCENLKIVNGKLLNALRFTSRKIKFLLSAVPFILATMSYGTASAQTNVELLGNPGFEDFNAPLFGNNLNTVSIAPWILGTGDDPNVVRVDGVGGQDYIRGPEIDAANPGPGINQHYLDIINGSNDFYQPFTVSACPSLSSQTYRAVGSFSSRANRAGNALQTNGSMTIRNGSGPTGTIVAGPDLSVANLQNRTTWTTLSGNFDLIPGTYSFVVQMGDNANFDGSSLQLTSLCLTATNNDYSATPIPASGGVTPSVFVNDDIDSQTPTSSTVDVTLTNTGGVTGATINPDGTINIPAGLSPGNYTLNYEICEAGSTTNCASATAIITVLETPAIDLAKVFSGNADEDGSSSISIGDTLTYTITATNTGNAAQTNFVVTDNLLTPSSNSCAAVPVGGTCTLTGEYVVTVADAGSNFTNTASVVSDELPTPVEDTVTLAIDAPAPALDIVKTLTGNVDADSSGSVSIGDTLNYEIVATNSGNIAQNNVVVNDDLLTPDTQTCASLAVDAICTLTGTYVVTVADSGKDFVNTASAVSDEVTTPVEDTVTTPVVPAEPSFIMTKVANGEGPFAVGDTITYTYTVTNDGNVNINGVAVSDTHNGSGPAPTPSNETLLTDTGTQGDSTDAAVDGSWDTLAPGDIVTFTGTYTVTQTDVDNL